MLIQILPFKFFPMKQSVFLLIAMMSISPVFSAEPAKPVLIAHRGLHVEAPENTLPAFHLAWENGADGIEGDFYLTKDGVVVCSHDANTLRTSGTDFLIKEHSFEDLKKIDQGAKKGSKYTNTPTPTLKEVLATIPKAKKIFVEIKDKIEIIEPLAKVLAESGLEPSQIVLISFTANNIKRIKELHPEWKAYWLKSFTKDPALKLSVESTIATLAKIGADGLDVRDDPRIDDDFIKALHDAGYECHLWVINDPDRAWEQIQRGADSITTDRPDLLSAGIKAKAQQP